MIRVILENETIALKDISEDDTIIAMKNEKIAGVIVYQVGEYRLQTKSEGFKNASLMTLLTELTNYNYKFYIER